MTENYCNRCDHWDMCEGCPYTDERPVRIGKTPNTEANKIAEEAYRNIHEKEDPPTLKEMPTLHDKERYMQGYREGEKRGYERALDELLSWCDSKSDQIHNVPIMSVEVARKIESLRKHGEGD